MTRKPIVTGQDVETDEVIETLRAIASGIEEGSIGVNELNRSFEAPATDIVTATFGIEMDMDKDCPPEAVVPVELQGFVQALNEVEDYE